MSGVFTGVTGVPVVVEVTGVHNLSLVLRFIAEGVATRDGVCAYASFCTSKFLKNKGAVMYARTRGEDRLAACGARSS